MENEEIKKLVDQRFLELIPKYLQTSAFVARKLTDTPRDDLEVVPRKYVNMYGSVAGRPINSVVGQQYFDTTKGGPIFRRPDGAWVDGVGSVV